MRALPDRWSQDAIKNGLSYCWQTGLWWWAGDSFFPSDRREAPGVEKGVGHHGHQGVPVQACP
ncbi:hypothetical protein AA15973_2410 [Komagataeibacter sucrofermentans DSM 15973]|nr:hypothetical protein AA15973_2410 [Komagataeibacter sucrofermentans DSM 15973]